mgnify:CR=1 FL=1
MKKVAVAAFALLAIFLASVLMPCVLTAPDSSSPVLGADPSNDSDPYALPEGKGGVEGMVKIRDWPVENYSLKFEELEWNENNEMVLTGMVYNFDISDPNGKYMVKVNPGYYNIKAISTSKEVVSYPTITTVSEGKWNSGIDFTFVRSYSFHGNVSFEGMSLSGVNVSLTPTSGGAANVTQTDNNGHYQFNNLTGGTYEILFQKSGFADERQIVDITVQPYLIIPMERTGLPGINGFILEYDFQHSMMVIGLVGMIVMIVISLAVRFYLTRNPNMILNDDNEERIED